MPSRSLRSRRRSGVVGTAVLAAAALSGLTACTSGPAPAPATSSSVAGPTATPTPTTPFSADAPADVALAHFDSTVRFLLKSDPEPHGNDVIGALRRAGFSTKAMQITPDTTTIGRNVDSIEFSVLWLGKTCLIGQVGSAGYSSTQAPVLSTGKCLIGTTRTIG